MQVAVLNQYAGQNTIATEVARLLRDPAFNRVRVLMAFARGGGIGLLRDPLMEFLDRGGSGEAILGLDLGGTSPEALEALLGLGVDCFVLGVRGDRTFHPKVYLFDGDADEHAAIVGSSNWTAGGLDSNFEVCLRVDVRAGHSAEDHDLIADLERLGDLSDAERTAKSGCALEASRFRPTRRDIGTALAGPLDRTRSAIESGR